MTPQDRLSDSIGRMQNTWADLLVAWAENVERALTFPQRLAAPFDPVQVVEKAFDAAQYGVELQRRLTKAVVTAATSLVGAGQHVAEGLGQATRHTAEVAASILREADVRKEADDAVAAGQQKTLGRARAARGTPGQVRDGRLDRGRLDLEDEVEKPGMARSGTVDELRQRRVGRA